MNYDFPVIHTLSDILPAIEGRDEFLVIKKDGYTVVNYAVVMEDTFPPVPTAGGNAKMRAEATLKKAIRRECRGLIFDENDKLVGRRYHKFFNANERDETRIDKIDLGKPHRILEKLDGSMVSPIPVHGSIRWMTKGGISNVSMAAEVFVAKHPIYQQIAQDAIAAGISPIFEWMSIKERIIVDYGKERFVLTAVRNNATGAYYSYEDLVAFAAKYGIEVVQAFEITEDLINTIAAMEGSEGVVVRFDDGHMVKIKSEWYVLRHRSKDAITREKNVLEYIVNDKVDDVLPFLEDGDKKRLIAFQDQFNSGLDNVADLYEAYFKQQKRNKIDKKNWAISVMPTLKGTAFELNPGIVFDMYEGRAARNSILNLIKKNIHTQTKVDAIRHMWGNYSWNYSFEDDS